ncbi:MAG: arsenate reductase (azurin) large subunit, partial [Gaiellales bacterium]
MAGGIPAETPKVRVPLPPPDARIVTTACDYCPVACGYKAYIWPVARDGGPAAADNALGVDFPTGPLTGRWPSPNMHTNVTIDGQLQNVLIMPDPDADVVNVGGNHSTRGGTLALKLYRPDGATRDRLQRPQLRVNGLLQPIPWDVATDIVARLIRHVLDEHGELAMGFKVYSYGFFENTYTITKFAQGAIGTPNYAPHSNTAVGTDTPGLDDSGVDAFSAGFADYREADVLMVVGADPYETRSVAFMEWMVPGGATFIHVDPRRTFLSAYAEKNGGLHLRLLPGTDAYLLGAISRILLERGWEDREFIESYVTLDRGEIEAEDGWRRRRFGRTWEEAREELLGADDYGLERAAEITGVAGQKIERAAELLAAPVAGERPKSTLLFEKGLYWTHNYENTAAIGNLSILLGARGRPGRATSRLGGHQRGGASGASYPLEKSPTEFEGQKVEMDTELWTIEGNTRMVWSIGNDWVGGSGASQHLRQRLLELVRQTEPQISSVVPEVAIGQLKERVDNGGMFIVQNEIYLNDTSELADLVLPAATWGEEDLTRNNAERRLRLYGKIMDPPGEARPDWRIVADVATRMGFAGFDWRDSNAIFEESGALQGGRKDHKALIEKAQGDGVRAHELLRSYGTTGLQTPLRLENDELIGTPRLHADMTFKASNGKSMFIVVDLDAVSERNELLGPNEDEFWILTGRVNHVWESLYDDFRKPHLIQRYPEPFVEINPEDAAELGIESGDLVAVASDRVRTQTGALASASATAVAYLTDAVQRGQAFAMFHFPGSPANSVVAADASTQPINPRQPFKFGRGRIIRLGPTDLARVMPFAPRN